MADCKYNYSHIVINSNTPPLENNYSDMKMKENKLKKRLSRKIKEL